MRKIKIFIENVQNFSVGDFIVFQEYIDNSNKTFKVTKPIYAIYMGMDVLDMAAVMKYVKVPKEHNPATIITLDEHIEWMNFIDILGHWKHKPTFHELLSAFRSKGGEGIVDWDQIQIEKA